ncbi:hypothetical protein [Larsenimonas suaedae]|uniref:Uncharacterized protein n=1 Tax=Larsenimonas suaedae TaxID=1851019 RepID=A0ABU1GZ37_9GAMM|nr:hypothetical protein [Larsenimonas suaedae]MCM2973749.1 hypothetical protein [Larsenimonas suaedae]MDR5897273.1 hypothetical protein [Larsenimonas suaedae]
MTHLATLYRVSRGTVRRALIEKGSISATTDPAEQAVMGLLRKRGMGPEQLEMKLPEHSLTRELVRNYLADLTPAQTAEINEDVAAIRFARQLRDKAMTGKAGRA